MFAIKRNHVVITALVVMVAAAGYLSYQDRKSAKLAKEAEESIALNANGEIGALIADDTSVDGIPVVSISGVENLTNSDVISDDINIATSYTESEKAKETDTAAEAGEAVFVSATTDVSTFFVQEKLDREQGRSRQREMLMEMINSENLERDKKAECADKLLEIQTRIENETAAEAMIEAKGFGQSYVRIDDQTVDVIVSKSALTDAEIAQIEDIVKRKTGMSIDAVRISSIRTKS